MPPDAGRLESVPEPGDLVAVRGRRWIVGEVKRSAIADAIRTVAPKPEHLLTLASVEDDGMGEELRVIWEVEPGAEVIAGYGLPEPDGFDDPRQLEAFLHAVRWGAISSADVKSLQSPFRSGIEIEDYQLEPVVRAIQMPRANLLIADDVGLGKTIEAGLVIQEFITRHRARRVLIVCPPSLQLQWHDQMRDKFGLEFRDALGRPDEPRAHSVAELESVHRAMRYWPNPAHKKETTEAGPPRWNPDKSRCPDDMTMSERQELLEGSVSERPESPRSRRFAFRRKNGLEWFAARLTRFEDGVPVFHGYPEPAVPAHVLRVFLDRGAITPAEYRRLLKVRN